MNVSCIAIIATHLLCVENRRQKNTDFVCDLLGRHCIAHNSVMIGQDWRSLTDK